MKIRIRANTLRFRLGQAEVERLREGYAVEETTTFGPDSSMTWSVRVASPDEDPSIDSAPGLLSVTIPRREWLEDERVEGFRTTIESAPGHEVSIAVERDWACMAPRDPAEDHDSFPNPGNGC